MIFFKNISSLAFVLLILVSCNSSQKDETKKKYQKEFWEQCSIEFCGIIIGKREIHKGFGLACVKLRDNELVNHELYINDKVFIYKVIDDNIVFTSEVAQIRIGDSICFNIDQNHTVKRYRDKKLMYSFENAVIYETRKDRLFRPENVDCL